MRRHQSQPTPAIERTSARKGTVQMELALFLPIYAAMLMVLSTIYSFANTRSTVAVDTRHAAWMKRGTPVASTAELRTGAVKVDAVKRILLGESRATQGVVSATRKEDAGVYLKTLNLLTTIQMDHHVFTDTWDFKTIPFETQQQHSRLTLGKRVLAFGGIDRGIFSGIAASSGIGAAEAVQKNHELHRQRAEAQEVIRQKMQPIRNEIVTLEREVNSLTDQLQKLQMQIPVNSEAVLQLQAQIQTRRQKLNDRRKQLAQLEASVKFLDSTLPKD